MKTSASKDVQEENVFKKEYCTSMDMYNFNSILKTNYKGTDSTNEI